MENPWYSQVTPRLYPTTTESPPVNGPLSAIQPIFSQFKSDTLNLTEIRSKANNYLSGKILIEKLYVFNEKVCIMLILFGAVIKE